LGLIKKVFFADELAPIADDGFNLVASGQALSFADSWLAASAYSLRLYFDFSAYSDMAIGLGAMFGLRLPVNFDAPYRAPDIRSFWRRWHISLSSFFRDYVYIPLGGSRAGELRTYAIIIATMLLCGLWHGAGWTFVVWGALHGVGICVNRIWNLGAIRLPTLLAWFVTMLFVVTAWVLFRADNFSDAKTFIYSMYGLTEFGLSAFDWKDINYVAIGFVFAVVGPTSVALSEYAGLMKRTIAIVVGCGLFLVALRVGQGRGLEFIYFQF
jgi:D-alanyl-lipoteichoic acid acyltransferase DltB (MBOAT superfamily)